MADITRGKTFTTNETVTNTKLHQLVDSATLSNTVRADFDAVTSPVTASASTLSAPKTGEIWFDTANTLPKVYNGSSFVELTTASTIPTIFPWQHSGLIVEVVDTATLKCVIGSTMRDAANTKTMTVTGSDQAASIAVSGKGGLDTGSEANDTWYAFLIIEDSSEVNAQDTLLVAEANYPSSITFPTGYDLYRRVSWVRNNGSGNFITGQQTNDKFRSYDDVSFITSVSNTSWANKDASNFVPSTARSIDLGIQTSHSNNITKTLFVAESGRSGSSGGVTVHNARVDDTVSASTVLDAHSNADNVAVDSSQLLSMRVITSINTVYIRGYTDSLND